MVRCSEEGVAHTQLKMRSVLCVCFSGLLKGKVRQSVCFPLVPPLPLDVCVCVCVREYNLYVPGCPFNVFICI